MVAAQARGIAALHTVVDPETRTHPVHTHLNRRQPRDLESHPELQIVAAVVVATAAGRLSGAALQHRLFRPNNPVYYAVHCTRLNDDCTRI